MEILAIYLCGKLSLCTQVHVECDGKGSDNVDDDDDGGDVVGVSNCDSYADGSFGYCLL